jgi:hypothetical protein
MLSSHVAECKTLPLALIDRATHVGSGAGSSATSVQGLTLVHFMAQRKRFLLDRGCI